MDSPDQGATAIVISTLTTTPSEIHFTIEQIGSGYDGKFDRDKVTIVGIWKRGSASLPLTLGRADRSL